MPLEPLQCPQCGSPVQVEASAGVVFCNYCGSRLRINPGASGHPVGVLEDVKADAAISARQSMIGHLQERLLELRRRREALLGDLGSPGEGSPPAHTRPGEPGAWRSVIWLAVGLEVVGVLVLLGVQLLGSSSHWSSRGSTICSRCVGLAPVILLFLVGYIAWKGGGIRGIGPARGQDGVDTQRASLAALDEEIRCTQARIDELKAEMDRLARG